MATHMVPQDVEAEDKLVGFLSLKQFIMTVIGIGFGYLTFFFFTQVHPITAIIWLPPTIVFFVLGLYHRKDQPIEVFLASALTFYFKPRKRKWDQEGHEDHVIITAPPKVEHHYTKNFTGAEAASRLQNLSIMMDSKGWASKQISDWQNPQIANAATSENRLVSPQEAPGQMSVTQTYMQPADVMDENTSLVARDFENKIVQVDSSARDSAIRILEEARSTKDNSSDQTLDMNLPNEKVATINQKIIEPPKDMPVATKPNDEVVRIDTKENVDSKKLSGNTKSVNKDTGDSTTPLEHKNPDGSVEISLH